MLELRLTLGTLRFYDSMELDLILYTVGSGPYPNKGAFLMKEDDSIGVSPNILALKLTLLRSRIHIQDF